MIRATLSAIEAAMDAVISSLGYAYDVRYGMLDDVLAIDEPSDTIISLAPQGVTLALDSDNADATDTRSEFVIGVFVVANPDAHPGLIALELVEGFIAALHGTETEDQMCLATNITPGATTQTTARFDITLETTGLWHS